jgi:hypothetical protein
MSKIRILAIPSDKHGVGKFRKMDTYQIIGDNNSYDIHVDISYNSDNNDEYFLMDNLPLEERVEVLKNLKIDEYNKIKDFIENNPELHFEVNYTTSDGITRPAIIGEHLRFFS